jgi:hypothetical protein
MAIDFFTKSLRELKHTTCKKLLGLEDVGIRISQLRFNIMWDCSNVVLTIQFKI